VSFCMGFLDRKLEEVKGRNRFFVHFSTKKDGDVDHIGRKDRLPEDIRKVLEETEEATKDFEGLTIALAVDYGGHDETIRTIKKLVDGNIEITPENFESNLDTSGLPKIDLIIRTGGEKRLSGYMPWQSEYSELYFSDTYFPDFGPEKLNQAIKDYSSRERRFGK
jgi:undecaprenyl diphosphate synthase